MITVKRQGGIIQIMIIELLGLLKTFRRQKTAINMWKIVKKKCLNVAQKAKKCSNFARKLKKCRKSAKRYQDMPNNRCFQFPLGVTRLPKRNRRQWLCKIWGGGGGCGGGVKKVYVKMVNRPFPSYPGPLYQNEVQPLIWKWFVTLIKVKLIFTREVVYLASFWKWGFLELGRSLLSTSTRERHSLSNYTAFSWVNT